MGQRRRRHTPEQVIRKLREADRLLGEGQDVAAAAKQLEVSEQTLHRWRQQYGGLKGDDAKRLRELERENGKLKRMVSERRACRVTGQHRSTQRHRPRKTDRDDALRAELRSLARCHPRWGYRRAWASLRGEGWSANRKKIQRLWREEGLRVPAKRRKRQRLGVSTSSAARLRAERPDQVWALDFQFDTTADGRILKLLHLVDEHTREALAVQVERRIDSDHTVRVLDRIVAGRDRSPELLRMDNGPELTANALRDWCRFSDSGTSYIEPGSPRQNPFVESFGGKVRDEVLAVEAFDSLLEDKNRDRRVAKHLQHPKAALEPRLEDTRRLRGRMEDLT